MKIGEVTNLHPGHVHILYHYISNGSSDAYTFNVRPHKSQAYGDAQNIKQAQIRSVKCVVVPLPGDGWISYKTRFELEVINPGSTVTDYSVYVSNA